MKTLTFGTDVQLDDNGNWIAEGTQVTVSNNEFYLNRHKGFTPVIVTQALDYKGRKISIEPTVEWFSNRSFK